MAKALAGRVLLGVTGSVAAYKAVEVCRLLVGRGVWVQVAMTPAAAKFIGAETFRAITGVPVLQTLFHDSGTDIVHVERAHDVDALVIAPASANTIAKISLGLADNVLTSVALATQKPMLIAPAMETGMWNSSATQEHVRRLQGRGVQMVGPASGLLASGRSGLGRMAEPSEIAASVADLLGLPTPDMEGVRCLITAGPTREPIDPVRFLGNRSTGIMGIRIAEAACRRGAQVSLILGPTTETPAEHTALQVTRIETADQMLGAAEEQLGQVDVLIGAAAVSDFRPRDASAQKKKKGTDGADELELVENPDVLATLARKLRGTTKNSCVVGFAAETEKLVANARRKLESKGCDFVVANQVGPERGFGAGETEVLLVSASEVSAPIRGPKSAIADGILDKVVILRD